MKKYKIIYKGSTLLPREYATEAEATSALKRLVATAKQWCNDFKPSDYKVVMA